ncbi:MAG: 3-dehydroquinate synthase [Ruminococcaceae bacterium]|nr:3-dehydroquinate synthase [Oscillospiraceae bacterium]
MTTVKVNASTPYDVIIGTELLERCGALSAKVIKPCKVCIVTDDTVAVLYLESVKNSFAGAGFEVISFVFPHGEASKNTATLINILEFLAENRLTRADCMVALGGGVVGDMCGFAAAVYLRGIKFIQIPTTLLAAVDSSVGGKTGVDLVAGKNLAGAFHQPSLVICDYTTLDTLPREIFSDGCAEVIKYGVINDRAFFDSLSAGIRPHIESVIAACVRNKRDIVEEDEFDSGKRQLLNLGHTIGHAIEACSDFEISHGCAVAIGMVTVMRAAAKNELCPNEDLDSLISALCREGLPTECQFGVDELLAAATADKKRKGEKITLVVPYSIGDSRLVTLPLTELSDFISKGLSK